MVASGVQHRAQPGQWRLDTGFPCISRWYAVRRKSSSVEGGMAATGTVSACTYRAFLCFVNPRYKGNLMRICRLLLATAGAAVLLGALVSGASARQFSLSNQAFRSSFASISFDVENTIFRNRCQVTLEGSLHSRTLTKSSGTLIGYITSAILGPCEWPSTILRETLPWHVRYSGFTSAGGLPEILSIITHVIGFSWRIRVLESVCLVRSSATEPIIITYPRNLITHEIKEARLSGTVRTGLECLTIAGTFGGSAPVSLLGTTSTRISVSLI